VTLFAAAAVGAAVLGVGWTVQAAALPAPERAELVVARTALWLSRYRFVESAFAVGGNPAVHAQCLDGWFRAARSGSERGTELRFGKSARIVALEGRPLEVLGMARRERPRLAVVQLELAGCPRLLTHAVSADLQSPHGVRLERATVADRPAIGFDVPLKRGGMEVYVTPRTYRPIALSLTAGRFAGRSRIRLTHLTPALLTAFDGRG
jgi:hypothetical protein